MSPIYKASPDYSIYCDECTEFIDFGEIMYPKNTKETIKNHLRKEGWKFVGQKCYCPECNKNLSKEE